MLLGDFQIVPGVFNSFQVVPGVVRLLLFLGGFQVFSGWFNVCPGVCSGSPGGLEVMPYVFNCFTGCYKSI